MLFAGLTVMIAMAGLSVVGIPFLTVMGLCAAGQRSSSPRSRRPLTLLPALLGFAGGRLIPKPESRTARREEAAVAAAATNTAGGSGRAHARKPPTARNALGPARHPPPA